MSLKTNATTTGNASTANLGAASATGATPAQGPAAPAKQGAATAANADGFEVLRGVADQVGGFIGDVIKGAIANETPPDPKVEELHKQMTTLGRNAG
jgi:hypothetical protein